MSKSKVAVYGSLKRDFMNSSLLASSEYLGTQLVVGWDMYSLGAYPAVKRGTGVILVEIYSVSEEVLGSLDRLEGYDDKEPSRSYYKRVTIEIGDYGSVYIYEFNRDLTGYPLVTPTKKAIQVQSWGEE